MAFSWLFYSYNNVKAGSLNGFSTESMGSLNLDEEI